MSGRLHTVPIFVFLITLIIGVITMHVVSDYSSHVLTEQAVSQTARWFGEHLISIVAFGFVSLAAYSIYRYLSGRGQVRSV